MFVKPSRLSLGERHGLFALIVVLMLAGCGGGSTSPSPAQITQQLTMTNESADYTFHYSPGDSVDTARQEAYHGWITLQLGVNLNRKIIYYKYMTVTQKENLTGHSGSAFADPPAFSIHTIWTWDNHEVVHVMTATIGTPPSLFNEGFAVAHQTNPMAGDFVPRWSSSEHIHTTAKRFLQQGSLPNLSNIIETSPFFSLDSNITYPSAGSFVRYLIDRDGMSRMLSMFQGAMPFEARATTLARFQQIYGQSLTDAEQQWHAFLNQW